MELQPDNLGAWRWIVVNSSGGKDSQTVLRQVVTACQAQGVDLARVVVSHQCLGRMEWPGARELAEEQARHYGLRFEVTKYRSKAGEEKTLLEYVRQRGKWPDSQNRFCTSEYKRGPGRRVVVKLWREAAGPVLNVYGFRSEESAAREKKVLFARNDRFSSGERETWDWLPILGWTQSQVWADIRQSGVRYHRAYDLGMPRFSCCFCIFAPRAALLIAGRENPELLDEYCETETAIGHRFTMALSINDVREAIRAGEQPGPVTGAWNM